jgi:hypothetical protein
MSDLEIVAYVHVNGGPPPGMPRSHRLYYRDSRKGWHYLTRAGSALLRDNRDAAAPLIRQHYEALDRFMESAVQQCLADLRSM